MNIALLKAISDATKTDAGFGYFAPNAELKALSDAGYIDVKMDMKSDSGDFAARVNELGDKYLVDNGANAPTETAKPKAAKQTFSVSTMPKPADTPRTRTGSGESKYPFDKLELPDANGNVSSFFVPATEEMPEPWKSLTSAVSQANRKYANVVGKNDKGHDIYAHVRKFKIHAVTEGENKGAHIWRDVDGSGKAEEPESEDEQAQGDNTAQG